jgi:GNAT superfamily N-acetyltransferase
VPRVGRGVPAETEPLQLVADLVGPSGPGDADVAAGGGKVGVGEFRSASRAHRSHRCGASAQAEGRAVRARIEAVSPSCLRGRAVFPRAPADLMWDVRVRWCDCDERTGPGLARSHRDSQGHPGRPGLHGRVHVDAWKTTYRGIVPDAHLDGLTVESDIAHGFGRWLTEPREGWVYLVATTASGEIVEFAVGGPTRGEEPEYAGELGAIYVLKGYQGGGVGSSLVREIARHLQSIGLSSMLVWVLEQNPYRRFYEKLGAAPARHRVAKVAGASTSEIGYGWEDIRLLTTA